MYKKIAVFVILISLTSLHAMERDEKTTIIYDKGTLCAFLPKELKQELVQYAWNAEAALTEQEKNYFDIGSQNPYLKHIAHSITMSRPWLYRKELARKAREYCEQRNAEYRHRMEETTERYEKDRSDTKCATISCAVLMVGLGTAAPFAAQFDPNAGLVLAGIASLCGVGSVGMGIAWADAAMRDHDWRTSRTEYTNGNCTIL